MKKKNNTFVKVMASLALGAIIVSVIGTGILFLYELYLSPSTQTSDISPEELEALLQELQLEDNGDSENISIDEEEGIVDESPENDASDGEIQE